MLANARRMRATRYWSVSHTTAPTTNGASIRYGPAMYAFWKFSGTASHDIMRPIAKKGIFGVINVPTFSARSVTKLTFSTVPLTTQQSPRSIVIIPMKAASTASITLRNVFKVFYPPPVYRAKTTVSSVCTDIRYICRTHQCVLNCIPYLNFLQSASTFGCPETCATKNLA